MLPAVQTGIDIPQIAPPSEISFTDKALCNAAKDFVIETPEDSINAKELFKQIRLRKKPIEKAWDDYCVALNKVHKSATANRKKVLAPFAAADDLEKRIVQFDLALERAQIAAEAAIQRAVQASAEESVLSEAEHLAATGNEAAALALLDQPVHASAVVHPAEDTSVDGVGLRKYWYANGVDLKALVQAIAEGKADLEAVTFNMTYLNKQAGEYKDRLSLKYPGVEGKFRGGMTVRE